MIEQIEKYAAWIIAALIALVAWFSRRDLTRYDAGLDRIAVLEKTSVTQDQLDRIMDKLRDDHAAQHAENRDALRRIEDKIDAQTERGSASRFQLRKEVHDVSLRLATIEAKLPS